MSARLLRLFMVCFLFGLMIPVAGYLFGVPVPEIGVLPRSTPGAPSPPVGENAPGESEPVLIYELNDATNDDRGPGWYVYPARPEFRSHPGLFDLTGFRVLFDGSELIIDARFGCITNPWSAPEGYYHQLIDVYLDTEPGGSTLGIGEGPNVRFAEKHGWERRIKIAPWGEGAVYSFQDGVFELVGEVESAVLEDGRTIRARVPAELVGIPSTSWNYYVLIGGFDYFGQDGYRSVTPEPGEWTFGGGTGPGRLPNVIDILAPEVPGGEDPQRAMLGAYLSQPGREATVYPVGSGRNGHPIEHRRPLPVWVIISGLGACAILVVLLRYIRSRHREAK